MASRDPSGSSKRKHGYRLSPQDVQLQQRVTALQAMPTQTPKIQNTVNKMRARIQAEGMFSPSQKFGARKVGRGAGGRKAAGDAGALSPSSKAKGKAQSTATAAMSAEIGDAYRSVFEGLTPADDDAAEDGDDEEELKKDPFVTAGFALLKHGALKAELAEIAERTETRGLVLVRELELEHALQDEVIKAAGTKRRLIASLAEQIRQEKSRRDRLLQQKGRNSHAVVEALRKTLVHVETQRQELEDRVAQARAQERSEQATVKRLREIVSELAIKSEQLERRGLRVARRTATVPERHHRGDVQRWLSLLRHEDEATRKDRLKVRRLQEQLMAVPQQRQIAHLLRLDMNDRSTGPMGDGAALENLLSVADAVNESKRVEKVHDLEVRRLKVALEVMAPEMLAKVDEVDQKRRMRELQQEAEDDMRRSSLVLGVASNADDAEEEDGAASGLAEEDKVPPVDEVGEGGSPADACTPRSPKSTGGGDDGDATRTTTALPPITRTDAPDRTPLAQSAEMAGGNSASSIPTLPPVPDARA